MANMYENTDRVRKLNQTAREADDYMVSMYEDSAPKVDAPF